MHSPDIIGQTFGQWIVIALAPSRGYHTYSLCRCQCGTEKEVKMCNLLTGRSSSCGCRNGDILRARMSTHQMTSSPEYKGWANMKARCDCKAFRGYSGNGGRGITYAPAWAKFEAFYADMGPRPTPAHFIARLDMDGNYTPTNCRWATAGKTRINSHLANLVTV